MRLIAEQKPLAEMLNEVSRVIETRLSIPILGHLLIEARGDALSASGTNLDMELSGRTAVNVLAEGSACVPAEQLAKFVSSLPSGAQISLEFSDSRLMVKAGRARINLPTLDPRDFPIVTAKTAPANFTIPAAELCELIDRTLFAASTDIQTKHYLCGILLHVAGGAEPVLRAAATDIHRMSHFSSALPLGAMEMPSVIVPTDACRKLRRLAEIEGDIQIGVSTTRLTAEFPGKNSWRFSTKLIEGTFPDYERVIPDLGNSPILTNRGVLINTIKRISIAAEIDRADRGHILAFDLSPHELSISGGGSVHGDAHETIDVSYEGPAIRVGFNSKTIVDCLDHMPGDEVEIHIRDVMSPAVLVDPRSPSARVVAVPYRV